MLTNSQIIYNFFTKFQGVIQDKSNNIHQGELGVIQKGGIKDEWNKPERHG